MRFFNVKIPIFKYRLKYDNEFKKIIGKDIKVLIDDKNYILYKGVLKNINKLLNRKIIFLKKKFYIKFLLKKFNRFLKKYYKSLKKKKFFYLRKKFILKQWKLKKKPLFVNLNIFDDVIEKENSWFFNRINKNRIKFLLLYDYLIFRYKKSFKKKIIFFRKKKRNKYLKLKNKIVSYFLLKKKGRGKKKRKPIKKKY